MQRNRVDENIRLYERGRFDIPKNADVVIVSPLGRASADGKSSIANLVTLKELFKLYFRASRREA